MYLTPVTDLITAFHAVRRIPTETRDGAGGQ